MQLLVIQFKIDATVVLARYVHIGTDYELPKDDNLWINLLTPSGFFTYRQV